MADHHRDQLDQWIAEMLRREQALADPDDEAFRRGLERKIASALRWEKIWRVAKVLLVTAGIAAMAALVVVTLLAPSQGVLVAWCATALSVILALALFAVRMGRHRLPIEEPTEGEGNVSLTGHPAANTASIDAEEPAVGRCQGLQIGDPAGQSAGIDAEHHAGADPAGKSARTNAEDQAKGELREKPSQAPAATSTKRKLPPRRPPLKPTSERSGLGGLGNGKLSDLFNRSRRNQNGKR